MVLIIGKRALEELLRAAPERIRRVYSSKRKGDPLLQQLIEKGIRCSFCSREELTERAKSDSHQGYLADLLPRQPQDLRDFLSRSTSEESLLLVLDAIDDPRNLGALLRVAECFGAEAVLFSKNRGCGMTPVVAKASAGASELVSQIVVSNLVEAVKALKEAHYAIIAAEKREGAESLDHFVFPRRSALIMGSEGEGIRPLLSRQAERHLYIPMWGQIASLNVAQAAAVLLSRYRAL